MINLIWENLSKLHKNCIKPIVENFGSNNIKITSAYRCKRLNDFIDGSKNSQHTKGYAVDLISINHSLIDLFNWCKLYLPEWNQLILEYPERGNFTNPEFDFSWLHISYIEGNNPKTCSMSSKIERFHNEYQTDATIKMGDYTHGIELIDKNLL